MTENGPKTPLSNFRDRLFALRWMIAGVAAVFAILCLAQWISIGAALVGGSVIIFLLAGLPVSLENSAVAPETGVFETAEPNGEDNEKSAGIGSVIRSAIEQFPDPVILLDPDGDVILTNGACRHMIGDQVGGGHISTYIRTPSVLEAVRHALADRVDYHVDYSQLVPVERHIRASAIPLGADGNSPQANLLAAGSDGASAVGVNGALLLVLHDLTAMKRAEQMRVDFIANASHELRTPLASLNGFIQTLKGHAKDDAEARDKFLNIMEDQTERMRRLIDDLLSLSRIEQNEHVVPKDEVSLIAVVRDVADALGPLAADRHQSIEITWQNEPLQTGSDEAALHNDGVQGEYDELVQLTQNLVHNAIKYGRPNGKVRIDMGDGAPGPDAILHRLSPKSIGPISLGDAANRVPYFEPESIREISSNRAVPSVEGKISPSNFLYLVVADDGMGIARAHLPRLTERFYRVDETKSREVGGTGLGLAIVKHIVNRHRGWMNVASRVGEGSSFVIFLPKFASLKGVKSETQNEATLVELRVNPPRKASGEF